MVELHLLNHQCPPGKSRLKFYSTDCVIRLYIIIIIIPVFVGHLGHSIMFNQDLLAVSTGYLVRSVSGGLLKKTAQYHKTFAIVRFHVWPKIPYKSVKSPELCNGQSKN